MPRRARVKSLTGIYHIIIRGINKQTIFADDEDSERFMQVLSECKQISGFMLYGYCLMGNHVHLLLKEEVEELSQIFKRIGSRYVYWYNAKYERIGHLFQDRFRSEAVEDDRYFLAVLRYIHQNPIKSGLSKSMDGYKWSSYTAYTGKNDIVDIEFAQDLTSKDQLIEFMNSQVEAEVQEYGGKKHLTDEKLVENIISKYNIKPMMIQNESKQHRNRLIKEILKQDGASVKQLARVTGIAHHWKNVKRKGW